MNTTCVRSHLGLWLTASLLATSTALAAEDRATGSADNWPAKAIHIIVPQPPGGGFDTTARIIADKLGTILGQSVVVENKPGAGTLLGTEHAARATPDGYTLLLGALSNIALNPGMYTKLSYDPLKDFVPIGLAVTYSYTLVGRPDLPYNSLQEVIEHAKANPGTITYASAGNGSGQHIASAATAHMAAVDLLHVPYRGAAAAYQDLLSGRVDLFFDISSTARNQIAADKVKALAVSSRERQPMHPDVPSVAETGVAPLEMESWFGLFAPAGIPEPIVDKLRAAFAQAMAEPDVIERWKTNGGRPLNLSPEETRQLVQNDVERWTKLLREMNIRLD